MNKAIFALLSVLAVDAFAGEVGAQNPDHAEFLLAAAWDAGVSDSWTIEPTDSIASRKSMQEFELRAGELNAQVNRKLERLLEEDINAILAERY